MLSPPISVLGLRVLEAAGMRILRSLGNYSPTALSAASLGHSPTAPNSQHGFWVSLGHPAWLVVR